MNLESLARLLDPPTLRKFIEAVRNMIEPALIQPPEIQPAQPPAQRDYNTATLGNTSPPGGWLDDSELRRTAQQMNEAIAAEKWTEGFLLAMQLVILAK